MGIVYEAFDAQRGELVALKTFASMDGASIYRLKHEFRILADVVHPNLIRLHELSCDGPLWFFTMARVVGLGFMAYVRRAPSEEGSREQAAGGRPALADAPPNWLEQRDLGTLDEECLRDALAQLVHGVMAVHAAGKLHRDLKPSNVLVDASGHVTVLDFGFAQSLRPGAGATTAGTPAYMAAEQLSVDGACTASDAYAIGTMLYEALTGRLPFEGRAPDILRRKARLEVPPHASSLAPNAPPDLAELAAKLLHPTPDGRMTLERVAAHLASGGRRTAEPTIDRLGMSNRLMFVARLDELATLTRAFDEVERGLEARAVLVSGVSGIGKTALVEEMLARISARALVLAGRCYEREAVPFKAIDPIVDALSHRLQEDDVGGRLELPSDLPELLRLFPVLGRVSRIADAAPTREPSPDPHVLRRRGFGALCEILRCVASYEPVVIFVDDIQWGDVDSGIFLRDLVSGPSRARVMLVVAYRSDEAAGLVAMLRDALQEAETIDLGTLGEAAATELASIALSGSGSAESRARIKAIVNESGGHPLFITELARTTGPRAASLSEVIRARVEALDESARTLLQIVALSGRPIPRDAVLRSAGVAPNDDAAVPVLRAAGFLRSTATLQGEALVSYHDRIREVVLRSMDNAAARVLHRAIASSLSTVPGVDVEQLARHYREGGDRPKALQHTIAAAGRAFAAAAFEPAAVHYRDALDLVDDDSETRRKLALRLGEALTSAGRGGAAAEAFLALAEDAPAVERVDLQARAATALVSCGDLERGIVLMRDVSRRVGLALPRSSLLAFVVGGCIALYFHLCGIRPRVSATLSSAARRRGEIALSFAFTLAMVDFRTAVALSSIGLLQALRSGDEECVHHATVLWSWVATAFLGAPHRRLAEYFDAARAYAAAHDLPRIDGTTLACLGITAFHRGEWKRSLAASRSAEKLLERLPNVSAELHYTRAFGAWASFYVGEIAWFASTAPALAADARARGNMWGYNSLACAFGPVAMLARDDVEEASRSAEDALALWPRAERSEVDAGRQFQVQHYWYLLARGLIGLYAGRGKLLHEEMEAAWGGVFRSGLLFAPLIQGQLVYLRAGAAIVAAEESGVSPSRAVARWARTLEKTRVCGNDGCALIVRAALASIRGEHVVCSQKLAAAVAAFEMADMRAYAAAARRQLGCVLGGDEGAAHIDTADRFLRSQGVVRPDRFASMLAPGFMQSVSPASRARS